MKHSTVIWKILGRFPKIRAQAYCKVDWHVVSSARSDEEISSRALDILSRDLADIFVDKIRKSGDIEVRSTPDGLESYQRAYMLSEREMLELVQFAYSQGALDHPIPNEPTNKA